LRRSTLPGAFLRRRHQGFIFLDIESTKIKLLFRPFYLLIFATIQLFSTLVLSLMSRNLGEWTGFAFTVVAFVASVSSRSQKPPPEDLQAHDFCPLIYCPLLTSSGDACAPGVCVFSLSKYRCSEFCAELFDQTFETCITRPTR
jgi:hypothetical protein